AGLAHMPAGTIERLTAFVAGSQETPKPVSVAAPQVKHDAMDTPRLAAGGELWSAVMASRSAFVATGVFSFVINILMLAGPLFMLQVYDRVMTSGSIPTLVALSIMTAGLYVIIGVLELVRSRIVVRVGVELDRRISDRVFQASLRKSLLSQGASVPALRELDNLRQFLGGPGPLTFFDAPWTPVYLLVVFLLHWTLGVAATIGAVVLLAIAWASEVRSRAPLMEAGKAAARSLELADTGQRNAEAITSMGMMRAYLERWQKSNREALAWQVLASDRLGSLSSSSKSLRLLLQSMMLAIGAALAIRGDISAGSIVAATIIFGRALAPVEQAIGQWRPFVKAREAYARLDQLLRQCPPEPQRTALPAPKGHLQVSQLRVSAPETRQLILSGLNFEVRPGMVLAVVGPSASGKSTLARAIVGLWPTFGGQITLDGARLDQWSQEALGRHIGYLPQAVELFAGTVKENISRFRANADDAGVIEAARMAHAHDMILALPQGYETQLGNFGTYLSAGQRQRIGLARALYGNPAVVVLDEPNSNLDRVGDEALAAAMDGMRKRGQAGILVSHRVQAIGKADLILYIERGTQRAFGPRNEVLKALQAASGDQAVPQPAPQQKAPAPQPAPAALSNAKSAAAKPREAKS
ncbi:MAG TPA: type I secretion system permease/ATPase, partial [Hyphomicrobiaceae bacterium]|nr:type I secretion system permease/ATPase [Hyphomicrobiaceae bacterium]